MSKEAMKLACKALRDCHYYMINAGLPNQSLLNEAFTAYMELEAALAEQPAQQVVDCHATGVCVQSGLRAEQPAQQELTNIERHERNVQTFLGEQPAPVAKPHEQEPFGFAVMENPIAPPAQRTWVGLTDEERDTLIKEFNGLAVSFYKAIEAKLRSKNEDRN